MTTNYYRSVPFFFKRACHLLLVIATAIGIRLPTHECTPCGLPHYLRASRVHILLHCFWWEIPELRASISHLSPFRGMVPPLQHRVDRQNLITKRDCRIGTHGSWTTCSHYKPAACSNFHAYDAPGKLHTFHALATFPDSSSLTSAFFLHIVRLNA